MKYRRCIACFLIAVLTVVGLHGCDRLEAVSSQTIPAKSRELAVIVNQASPLSQEIAAYYQQQRQIPAENMIRIQFDPNRVEIPPDEFRRLQAEVDAKTPQHIQGYALTWAAPYRVSCMSITSAFALGFDERYCASGCQPTANNPYFNQTSQRPYSEFGLRPTMAIAATSFVQAKALIDRGVASDGKKPTGTAYLLSTSDRDRNVRATLYGETDRQLSPRFSIEIINIDALQDKQDVMFYFTGTTQVGKLETNRFLPGAIADHVTSFGGMLTDSSQMSSLRWIEAGATASYGTVVEPCNFPQKFPHPGVAMVHYLNGDTLLQAYWKSVLQPGQGIFIGEPLAQPFWN